MTHLSATEIISQLSNSKKLPEFQKQNGLIYRQTKYAYERRLSPWERKRKHSKSNKNPKISQQTKDIQSDKTEQFLKKIFPNKHKQAIAAQTDELGQTKYKGCQKILEQQKQKEQNPFIFLPIKNLNLKKNATSRQFSIHFKQKSKTTSKGFLRTVEPQISLKFGEQYSHRAGEAPRMPPMMLTFRRSWRKREKCKTQPCQYSINRKKLSIGQVYDLIGKRPNEQKISYYEPIDQCSNLQFKKDYVDIRKTQWLVPRSMKTKKTKNLRYIAYKTQVF